MEDLQKNAEFKQALIFHQKGNVDRAKAIYLRLLNGYADNARLLNNLAMIEFQLGKFESGLTYLEKSLAIDQNQFAAYGNRGAALFALGRLEEAYDAYNQAIVLNNDYAEAYYNRGILHERFERFQEALADYRRAVELKPHYAKAHNNQGNILKKLGENKEALLSYANAIKANPQHAEAYYNRGVIFKEECNYPEALICYQQAIALNSQYMEAYNNCGNVLIQLRRFEDALLHFQKAIQLNQNYAYAYNGQGNALMELKRFDDALLSYENAILLNSSSKANQAENTLPNQKKRTPDADLADPYWNKAMLKILLGECEEGWKLYEYRRHRSGQKESYPDYDQPLWIGQETIKDKVLYIYPEQGLGDFIQFCRYIPLAEQLGAKIVLKTPAALHSIIKAMELKARLADKDEKVTSFDFHCPIMSLPLAFKTTLDSVPNTAPYLHADNAKKLYWKEKFANETRLKVGLVWSGSKDHKKDHDRSLRLEQLTPLLDLPVAFYSLQKEVREEDQATLSRLDQIQEYAEELNDFSDTAALVDNLDLIISVDTSVAHLAGAMAKDVWIMISYLPDYRWMLDRDDSPWYPTATLFRQPAIGDWESVIGNVKQALQEWLASK